MDCFAKNIFLVLIICVMIFFVIVGDVVAKVYKDGDIVYLDGSLLMMESIPGDSIDGKIHKFPAIKLDVSFDYICENGDGDCAGQSDVLAMQLLLDDSRRKGFEKSIGKKIVVAGKLYSANTAHHFTPVLIEVLNIDTSFVKEIESGMLNNSRQAVTDNKPFDDTVNVSTSISKNTSNKNVEKFEMWITEYTLKNQNIDQCVRLQSIDFPDGGIDKLKEMARGLGYTITGDYFFNNNGCRANLDPQTVLNFIGWSYYVKMLGACGAPNDIVQKKFDFIKKSADKLQYEIKNDVACEINYSEFMTAVTSVVNVYFDGLVKDVMEQKKQYLLANKASQKNIGENDGQNYSENKSSYRGMVQKIYPERAKAPKTEIPKWFLWMLGTFATISLYGIFQKIQKKLVLFSSHTDVACVLFAVGVPVYFSINYYYKHDYNLFGSIVLFGSLYVPLLVVPAISTFRYNNKNISMSLLSLITKSFVVAISVALLVFARLCSLIREGVQVVGWDDAVFALDFMVTVMVVISTAIMKFTTSYLTEIDRIVGFKDYINGRFPVGQKIRQSSSVRDDIEAKT